MKRWSYATAIMLSLAGGTIMTGCIDNDEPYGIEQIRLATADFLKSKKAAVEAEAAAANAQVEIEKIKAETEKLRIEAEAAIKAAQAKILEAQANKEQAEADKIKAETDAYIASQKAKLDEFIAQAEIRVKQSELDYQTALYWFEQTKITNAEAATSKLYQAWALAFQAYLDQLSIVNGLNQKYLLVQKDYALAEIDLKYNKVSGEWESNKYDAIVKLGNTVTWLEKEIKKQNDEIAFQQSVIADFENVKTSDLYQLFEKYNAANTANTEALAKAKVELAALAVDNKALYDSRIAIEEEISSLNSEKITIPAYSVPAMPNVPWFQGETPVVVEDLQYSLNEDYNYYFASASYTRVIWFLEHALMDENDKAWTQASINEMTRQLAAAQTSFETAKGEWTLAKKVYNNGNVADASVLPLAKELSDAIAAYESAGASIANLRQKKIDADNQEKAAFAAYNAALKAFKKDPASVVNTYNEAIKAYSAALTKAHTDWQAALKAADQVCDEANEAAVQVYNATMSAFNIAEKDLEAANIELAEDPSNTTLQANQKTAQEAYNKALAAVNGANDVKGKAEEDAQKAKVKAYNLARAAKLKAESAAASTFEAAKKAYLAAGGSDNEKDPAYAPVAEATKAYETAQAAAQEAQNALENANAWKVYDAYDAIESVIKNQEKAINHDWILDEYYNALQAVMDYCDGVEGVELPELIAPALYINTPNADAPDQIYYNAKNYLVEKSMAAFGNLGVDYDKNYEYGFYSPDKAFLVDDVTKEMVNAYIHAIPNNEETPEYAYGYFYNLFGLYGDTLELDYSIAMAKAALNNTDDINAVLKTLNENLTSIKDAYEAQEKKVAEATEEKTSINTQIDNLEQGVKDKIADLDHWSVQYGNILSTITSAIETIENITPIKGDQYVQGNIDTVINALVDGANDEIAKANNQIEYLNKQLDKAKYQLGLYEENKDTVLPNIYEIPLEVAEANLAAAQEKLAFLKAHADDLQAQYEAASKQQ